MAGSWIRNSRPREVRFRTNCGIYRDNKGLSERTDTLGIFGGASARFINVGGVSLLQGPMNRSLLLILLLTAGTSSAQVTRNWAITTRGLPSESDAGQRLLTWSEGVQVIEVAWKNLSKFDSAIDCSHLVNQIYELAGVPYQYATSNELYQGVDRFERVQTPQPADLIVWPGHVGLIVNPQEHSFYSSLNSGLKIDSYDSATWRARGPARFFRLVMQNGERVRSTPREDVLTERTDDDEFDNSATDRRAPVTARAAPKPKFVSTSSDEIFLKLDRPKKAMVQTDLLQAWSHTSDERQDRWQQASEAVIVETLKVERISLKGTNGTLEAKIKSVARLTPEEMQIRPTTNSVTFRLLRTQTGWKIEDRSGRMYLTGDAAVVAISEHLAGLAREKASRAEQAETAALLHSLLR